MAGQAGAGSGESFIAYWVEKLLFHDFDETCFTIAYGLFFVLVVLTLLLVPVQRKKG